MTVRDRANMIWEQEAKYVFSKSNMEIKDRCVRFCTNAINHHCINKQQTDFISEVRDEIINIYKFRRYK